MLDGICLQVGSGRHTALELSPDIQPVKHGLGGKGTLDVAMSKSLR